MTDADIGLLADTGRELYVADAISDLTRLRLHLASAPLAEIPARPEWGSISASLRALGESVPAAIIDAFAHVLSSAGISSNAAADREFVAAGIDAIDLLLRAGDGFDPARMKGFVERVTRFCDARGLARPAWPDGLLDDAPAPAADATERSPFGTDPAAFPLPPIDPPSWDFDPFRASQPDAQAAPTGAPEAAEDANPWPAIEAPAAAPAVPDAPAPHGAPHHPVRTAPVTESWFLERPEIPLPDDEPVIEAAPVPAPPAAFEPAPVEPPPVASWAPAPVMQAAPEPVFASPEPVAAPAPFVPVAETPVEPPAMPPAPVFEPVDPVAELAARFDDIPAAPAAAPALPVAASIPVELARLAQGALWLADSLRAGAAPTPSVGTTLDAIRRDALSMLAVEQVVAVVGGQRSARVGEAAAAQLRRLQQLVGEFEDFAVEGEWCRADLSAAGASALAGAGFTGSAPLIVASDDGRRLWLPAQPERLSVWHGVSDDGIACVLPDLVADAPAAGSTWRALKLAADGRPEVVAVAGSVPLPERAPVLRTGSGAVVLDPARWTRRRATCFALARSLDGHDWVAGAAILAGEPAVLVDLAAL